jgi:hypothetical protein
MSALRQRREAFVLFMEKPEISRLFTERSPGDKFREGCFSA